MDVVLAILIFVSFLVSASCGLGGSLILIPGLSLILGLREGIVISSILLGLNNLVKIFFFRRDIRLRPIASLMIFMMVGAAIGAFLMFKVNKNLLAIFLFAHIIISFFIQQYASLKIRKNAGLGFSFLSGLCSGLSGTSGPLKGLAVKCHMNVKTEIVAAAAVLSLITDSTKSIIYLSQYTPASLSLNWLLYSVAVMPVATGLGRYINRNMSIKAYEILFYLVLSGYVVRMVL